MEAVRRRKVLAAVVVASVISAVTLASGLSSDVLPRGSVVLDQQEIGTYEAAYDPQEELAVDNEYEAAMPFRDPGHISRAEIRLAHALARSGTTKRDESWSFIKPLWAKYIQAMRDPSDVQIGWTNPRHMSKDADYLQQAVERHAYGAEGHREPEREFDVGEPSTGPGFEWDRDLRKGLGLDKPEGFQATMPHMMKQDNGDIKQEHGDIENGGMKKSKQLETQVFDMHHMLQSTMENVNDLKDELSELRAEKSAAQDSDSLREQLTYKVMKDKLKDSRLKAKIAEEKAKREARKASESSEVQKMLAEQKDQMKSMQKQIEALKAAKESAAKHHDSRKMSAEAAQQDLASYFTQLNRQEAKEEVKEATEKLEKFTSLLGAKGPTKQALHFQKHVPFRSMHHAAKDSADEPAPAQARRSHRGSLLEATSFFDSDSDEKHGLSESKSAHQRQRKKAHEQELAIISAPASKHADGNLESLVAQLKADTTNVAPYLPL